VSDAAARRGDATLARRARALRLLLVVGFALLLPLVALAQQRARRAPQRQRVTRTRSGEVRMARPDPTPCSRDAECLVANGTYLANCCVGGGCNDVAVHETTFRARDRVCAGFACTMAEQLECAPRDDRQPEPRAVCRQRRCVLAVSPSADATPAIAPTATPRRRE
jgi:hypothetical protein